MLGGKLMSAVLIAHLMAKPYFFLQLRFTIRLHRDFIFLGLSENHNY